MPSLTPLALNRLFSYDGVMSAALDAAGTRSLNSVASSADYLMAAAIFAAEHLIFVMAALILAMAAAAWKTPRFGERAWGAAHAALAFLAGFAAENAIGFLWFRARPFVTQEDVSLLISMDPEMKSFPSGHATAAFAISFAVFVRDRRWGTALLVLAALVALGRVAVGVHFPTDIAAGAVVGFLAAAATAPLKKRIEPYLELFQAFSVKSETTENAKR